MSQFQGLNEQFYKELAEESDAIRATLYTGSIASFEEYKRLVGKLSGLQYAAQRHKELINNMKASNEN